MKVSIKFFTLLMSVFVLSACTLSSTPTPTPTPTPTIISNSDNPWVGEWRMTSEVTSTAAGEITNPATNKTIEFLANNEFIEDYSELEGLGVCDETKGRYSSTWEVEDDSISVDIPGSSEEVEPYIDCGPGAGTNAVPRSIAHFSYDGTSWDIQYDESTDMITATISGPPGTITQEFERQ